MFIAIISAPLITLLAYIGWRERQFNKDTTAMFEAIRGQYGWEE